MSSCRIIVWFCVREPLIPFSFLPSFSAAFWPVQDDFSLVSIFTVQHIALLLTPPRETSFSVYNPSLLTSELSSLPCIISAMTLPVPRLKLMPQGP